MQATLMLSPTGRKTFSDKDYSPVFKFKQVNKVLIPAKEKIHLIANNDALEHVRAEFVFNDGTFVEHTKVLSTSKGITTQITTEDLNRILSNEGICELVSYGGLFLLK